MTLSDINHLFSTDDQCRVLLAKLRWPLGKECVRCKSKRLFDLPEIKRNSNVPSVGISSP